MGVVAALRPELQVALKAHQGLASGSRGSAKCRQVPARSAQQQPAAATSQTTSCHCTALEQSQSYHDANSHQGKGKQQCPLPALMAMPAALQTSHPRLCALLDKTSTVAMQLPEPGAVSDSAAVSDPEL
jgi:hypothetical protein